MHSLILHCLVDGTSSFPTMPQSRIVKAEPNQLASYAYGKQPDLVVIESENSDVQTLAELVKQTRSTYDGSILVAGNWVTDSNIEPLLLCGAQDVLHRDSCRSLWQSRMINLMRLDARESRVHFRCAERLRSAIEDRRVILHAQPILQLDTSKPVAYELLARITNSTGELLSPARFIPVAEKTGLIIPLGHQILEEGLAAISPWRNNHNISFNFNLSTLQLSDSGFLNEVLRLTHNHAIARDRITFEITESEYIGEDSSLLDTLQGLRSEGFKIAIDDFGTGYSALEYLTRIEFDVLKLDRKFLGSALLGGHAKKWLQVLIQASLDMGIQVVAEGIETEEHLEFIKSCGPIRGQGFLLGKPGPVNQFNHSQLNLVA